MVFIEDPSSLSTDKLIYFPLFSVKECTETLDHYRVIYETLLAELRAYNWDYGFLFNISRETLVFEKLVNSCKHKLIDKFNLTELQIYLLLSNSEISLSLNTDPTKTEKNKLLGILNLCAALYGIQFFWKNSLKKETSTYMIKHWVTNLNLTEDEVRSRLQDLRAELLIKMNELVSVHSAGFLYTLVNLETSELEVNLCKIPLALKQLILGVPPSVIELDCLYVPESILLHMDFCCIKRIIRQYTELI